MDIFFSLFNNLSQIKIQKFPDCLIIGVRKGGTRAFLDGLSLHPNIQTVRYEVHFFNNLSNYKLGLKWYLKKMPFISLNQVNPFIHLFIKRSKKSLKISIEKTPAYFINKDVPIRIKKFNPNIKLILIVRNPVIRMISDFTQVIC